MRLSKPQSVAIAVGSLILFFVVGVWAVQSGRKPIVPPPLSAEERAIREVPRTIAQGTEAPGASASVGSGGVSPLTLKTFHRSEVRDGKKLWEISADEGKYFPEKSMAEVLGPDLFVYTPEGDKIRIQAVSAELMLDGPSLVGARLVGQVRVQRNDDLLVTTDEADYDKVQETVRAPGLVTLTSQAFDVSGVGVDIDVARQVVKFSSQVSTVIRPRENLASSETRE